MLQQFTTWLLTLVREAFTALFSLIQDVFVWCCELLLNAILAGLQQIGVPSFMAGGLSSVFSGLSGGVIWFCTQAGVPQALVIIGAGYGFRILRKIFTLGQW